MPTLANPHARRRGLPSAKVRIALAGVVVVAGAAGTIAVAPSAFAANESGNIWLTTTSDSGGRTRTRRLQQPAPIPFAPTSAAANPTTPRNAAPPHQQIESA